MLAAASDTVLEALREAWLRTTAGRLLDETNPFRNPVGHALRESLPVLLDVALGRIPAANADAPLERLMRIRAVQDCTPAQAIGFVLELYPLLRGQVPAEALEDRVNGMALTAFDAYVKCREQAHAIQLKELRRRMGPV